jgi:hypothetical protein
MAKFGVIQFPLLFGDLDLKKHVLMFDKVIFIKETLDLGTRLFERLLEVGPNEVMGIYQENIRNVEFLQNRGRLEIVPVTNLNAGNKDMEDLIQEMARKEYTGLIDDDGEFIEPAENDFDAVEKALHFTTRAFALAYGSTRKEEIIPVVDTFYESKDTSKEKVYRFVLHSIPEPDDSVPWEQIMDFKSDHDANRKYYRLINWINEIAKSGVSEQEAEDKYKELLYEYSAMFNAHKMATTLGRIEWITKIATEIASLKFNKAHETFFSIFKEEANLLTAEGSFPGKEVAYIHKLNETFR